MQRKRNGLVPIGKVLSGLDGPVKTIREATPQAVHHFTRFDQIDQLIEAGEDDPDTGFMTRLITLCSLPRTNPGKQLQYKRVNGPYKLIMTATGDHKLPYGILPRLLLAWVCTEAVQTQSRVLNLGRSLYGFMSKLGMEDRSGSARGDRTRLRNQMKRLFNANVRLVCEDEHVERFVSSAIADRGEFWWDPKRPDEPVLWESKIRLGEDFFNEIISHPVPIDMNILKALKRSSLGLDLYLWLTYRMFRLKLPLALPWQVLYRQFGADPVRAEDKFVVRDFRKDCLRELEKIKLAWPELKYATVAGALILVPSKPSITPTNTRLGE